jgi:hypothetical protein
VRIKRLTPTYLWMIIELLRTLALFGLPGYMLAGMDRRLFAEERLCVSVLLSSFLLAFVSLILHLAGVPLGLWTFACAIAIAALAATIAKARTMPGLPKRLLIILLFAALMRVGIYGLNPHPQVGDSYVHYSLAKSFLTEQWYTSDIIDNYWTQYTQFPFPGSYRPPLQDFLDGLAMAANRPDPASAASMSVSFGLFLIAAIYVLAKGMFDGKTAILACILASFNFFLISRSIELEPRLMVSFFVLMMLYFAEKGPKYWPYAALGGSLSYLTHYSSIWFIASVVIYQLAKNRAMKVADALRCGAIFLALVSPWLIRNAILFGNPLYSTSRNAIYVSNPEGFATLSPPTLASYISSLGGGVQGWLMAAAYRLINLVTSYVPPPQKMLQYGITWTLNSSLVDLVNPLVFLAASIYILRNFKTLRGTQVFFTVVFSSAIAPLLPGNPSSDGVAIAHLSPLVGVFIVYAAAYLSKRGHDAIYWLVIASVVSQTLWLSAARSSIVPSAEASGLIERTVPKDAVVMSVQAHEINYLSGRRTMVAPYESWPEILGTARRYHVGYYVLTPTDMKLRDVSKEKLESAGELVGESADVMVYRLR